MTNIRKENTSETYCPSLDECIADAKKYSKLMFWEMGHPLTYYHAKASGLLDECTKYMFQHPTLEDSINSAKKFKTKSQWAKDENRLFIFARRRGWLDECVTATSIKSDTSVKKSKYPNLKDCFNSALKFTTPPTLEGW